MRKTAGSFASSGSAAPPRSRPGPQAAIEEVLLLVEDLQPARHVRPRPVVVDRSEGQPVDLADGSRPETDDDLLPSLGPDQALVESAETQPRLLQRRTQPEGSARLGQLSLLMSRPLGWGGRHGRKDRSQHQTAKASQGTTAFPVHSSPKKLHCRILVPSWRRPLGPAWRRLRRIRGAARGTSSRAHGPRGAARGRLGGIRQKPALSTSPPPAGHPPARSSHSSCRCGGGPIGYAAGRKLVKRNLIHRAIAPGSGDLSNPPGAGAIVPCPPGLPP